MPGRILHPARCRASSAEKALKGGVGGSSIERRLGVVLSGSGSAVVEDRGGCAGALVAGVNATEYSGDITGAAGTQGTGLATNGG